MSFNPRKSNLTFQQTATLNLVDPVSGVEIESDGNPVSIEVYSKVAKQHMKAVEVLSKKIEKRGSRKVSVEEMKRDSIDFLVAITVGSTNLSDENGEPVQTPEQFKELYSDDECSWIRDQVSTFASVDANFIPK